MTVQIDAIYDDGVLKPLGPLFLPDKARVKLIVNTSSENTSDDEAAAQSASADFDADLDSLLFDGPSLPPDFSRADIYSDHD